MKLKFGNKSRIAFQLIGDNTSTSLSTIKFYLGSKLISNEPVYIPTYISSLQSFLYAIKRQEFKNVTLHDASPEEVYKVLLKEKDTDTSLFFKHLFRLDETIDQYTIFILQSDNVLQFIWSCWDQNNCNADHVIDTVYAVEFSVNEIISVLDALLEQLINMSAA